MTLIERLRRLHDRLEDEGRYTDANIVWLAWCEIVNQAGPPVTEVSAEDRSR
jgi:hypothetical protein